MSFWSQKLLFREIKKFKFLEFLSEGSEHTFDAMQTIFWFSMVFMSLISETLALYFHLSHDDLKTGKVTAFEVTQSFREYTPIEVVLQAVLSISALAYGSLLVFVLNLPLLVYNIFSIVKGKFRYYAFTLNEYKDMHFNEKVIRFKLVYYLIILLIVSFNFLHSFTRMLLYRIFGI